LRHATELSCPRKRTISIPEQQLRSESEAGDVAVIGIPAMRRMTAMIEAEECRDATLAVLVRRLLAADRTFSFANTASKLSRRADSRDGSIRAP